ncbi:MAG: hypothetical protein EA412_10885 [Chitinophagaceae bacterium]|nr:MAG: hypothetical protein EA412_10885 [Chitinophagaceae bacterium]
MKEASVSDDNNMIDLIISYKFNDIYYSLNYISDNYQVIHISNKHEVLRFIDENNMHNIVSKNRFPFVQVNKLLREKKFNVDTVYLSNLELTISQYIISYINPRQIVIVEDGHYNYHYNFIENNLKQKFKNVITHRDHKWFKNKVNKVQIFMPDKVHESFKSFDVDKLILKPIEDIPAHLIQKLDNKKIFIGQPLSQPRKKDNKQEKENYERIVNNIIKKYEIDYYIEHRYSKGENIINKYDFYQHGYTLEMIAPHIKNLTIYTFGSSLIISLSGYEHIDCFIVSHSQIYSGSSFLTEVCTNELLIEDEK